MKKKECAYNAMENLSEHDRKVVEEFRDFLSERKEGAFEGDFSLWRSRENPPPSLASSLYRIAQGVADPKAAAREALIANHRAVPTEATPEP